MLETFTARSGDPSLRVNGRALHSPYDPRREAARFVADTLGAEASATVVVLGECLGYVSDAVRAALPGARVITVTYTDEIARAAALRAHDLPTPAPRARAAWQPGAGATIAQFLRAQLGELDIEGLRVIEWPPSSRAFPTMAREAIEAARQVVLELNGSFATTSACAGAWLRNSIANFLSLDVVLPDLRVTPERPIVIAAPGPSLERAVPLLREHRRDAELWALPSSCPLLASEGLAPDLIVLTDPGYYAMHHILSSRVSASLAMPLSAARGAWSVDAGRGPVPVLLLSQPVFYERALLRAAGLSTREVAPHGTVAATAVDLARAVTSGPIVVAGLDMCMQDVLSHARPNAFDTLLHLAAGRLRPHAGQWFERSALQQAERLPGAGRERVSPALRTYAGWFDATSGASRSVYRLLPSPVRLAGLRDLDAGDLAVVLRKAAATKVVRAPSAPTRPFAMPDRDVRQRIVSRLLAGWIADLESCRPDRLAAAPEEGEPGPRPTVLSIAYLTEPRLLLNARRLAREGRAGEAQEELERLIGSAARLLRRLLARTCNGQ